MIVAMIVWTSLLTGVTGHGDCLRWSSKAALEMAVSDLNDRNNGAIHHTYHACKEA